MLILGINMNHGDASAAIVLDGKLIFAVAEERLNRRKHFGGFPKLSILRCLESVGASLRDIDHVAVGYDPKANLLSKASFLLHDLRKIKKLYQMQSNRHREMNLKRIFAKEFGVDPNYLRFKEHYLEHHLCHVASSFLISPYEECVGFSIDGAGDFVSVLLAHCHGTDIDILKKIYLPHSLGHFYTAICQFIGFDKYGDEGKVMGLAPYGEDAYADVFSDMLILKNGEIYLNEEYFLPIEEAGGVKIEEDGKVCIPTLYSHRFIDVFGKPRNRGEEISKRDKDIAFCLQKRFEDAILYLLGSLEKKLLDTGKIVLAGGCALNSVANGRIVEETNFTSSYIQPAAGDEGLAIGAAFYLYNNIFGYHREFQMTHAYWGPEYSNKECKEAFEKENLKYTYLNYDQLIDFIAKQIADGKIVGWFQGRAEWGPRALGNRSILAHPGLSNMKDLLNSRIKHRESFRPFAPSILAEEQANFFECAHPSPFMLHVFKIRPEKRALLCAVNHVDNTGRLQSVSKDENPMYYSLIKRFYEITGLPVLLNTSFNENEPIVCSPNEAVDCFKRTKMDVLCLGNYVCTKDAK